MDDLEWRAPTRDDDPEWAALLAAIEVEDGTGETFDHEDLADEWGSVWAHPATDARFVWAGPDLVAFGWLKTRPGTRRAHRVECWGGVHPSRRGEGIGGAVLAWQLERAAERARDLDGTVPTVARLDALETQPDLLGLAARAGFSPVRRFLDVARPLAAPPQAPAPDGVEVRAWSPALDGSTWQAHVAAFADHWGSEPRTEAEWRQWYTGHRSFRPDLSRVAVDAATGEVVGFVLCSAYPHDWHVGPREVWIGSVGTRRAWRGRGVARALLADSLRAAAAAADDFERAILGVDAENPTGALALYDGLGFETVRTRLTLELMLSPEGEAGEREGAAPPRPRRGGSADP